MKAVSSGLTPNPSSMDKNGGSLSGTPWITGEIRNSAARRSTHAAFRPERMAACRPDFRQRAEAAAVSHVEVLGLDALVVDDDRAVGHHAVHVQDEEPDRRASPGKFVGGEGHLSGLLDVERVQADQVGHVHQPREDAVMIDDRQFADFPALEGLDGLAHARA